MAIGEGGNSSETSWLKIGWIDVLHTASPARATEGNMKGCRAAIAYVIFKLVRFLSRNGCVACCDDSVEVSIHVDSVNSSLKTDVSSSKQGVAFHVSVSLWLN